MATIILDADFLSSFLKIQRISLVREFYQNSRILLSEAVYREIARTSLLTELVRVTWLEIVAAPSDKLKELQSDREFALLGTGEQESIGLALTQSDSILLMSDNYARRTAERFGCTVANIPAFLLASKTSGKVNREGMEKIIGDLRTKDFYAFRPEIVELLLK
ncbi:MAG TPA: hypothetical protein VFD70_21440 [Anaerolineae bacterium]|nr:hypothetical protein [Anaerolineae bacterium]